MVNWSIYGKEKHLADGQIVYLELTPVDPRSLMQGDYMALRFRLINQVYEALPRRDDSSESDQDEHGSDGYVVASLDEQRRGTFKDLYNGQALSEGEILLRYRIRNGKVKFATNAFFFKEGDEKYYRPARYGMFRVDGKGDLLLEAMYDQHLNRLGPWD